MKDDTVHVDIGQQFSRLPAGRKPDDGKFCGETFRERFLSAPIAAGKAVVIKLDNVLSYGSSFLEEAFGGLVRQYSYSPKALRSQITLDSTDPYLVDEIWHYIDNAHERSLGK